MRITQQLLRSKANGPVQSVEFLDLSNIGIDAIEKLNSCLKLQALNLRGNNLVEVENLEQNKNLWRLDLSNNQIVSIDSLSKFIAMGTLNLANNDLSWHEIGKLRHLHVLDISLHGNKQLEKDPYSAERLQAKYFFADSALTDHPIRKKLSKEWFVPSAFKKIEINGVYGEKATHMMIRFPSNGSSNSDMDRRKLRYLAHNVQEDLVVEKKATKRDFQVLQYRKTFLEDLLDVRPADRERCNMLLVLLVATLEFIMPTHLVKETLEVTKLSKLGKVYTMDLFLLPKDVRCRIVCILLGAVKIDKDIKEDGGLYDRLYLCLFHTIAELTKLCNSMVGKNTVPKSKMTQVYNNYKCLLASEVVQLLCIVPAFFEYVDRDVGVMNLVVTATGDPTITDKIVKLSQTIHSAGGDVKKLYEELSDFLLQMVQEQSTNLTNQQLQEPPDDDDLCLPVKGYRTTMSPLDMAEYLAKGLPSPNVDPPTVLSARTLAAKSKKHFPHLGDYLLLGPQTLGKIISLPQPFVALVSMDSVPVANGSMESKLKQSDDHYTYVNMDQLAWDIELGFWKPKGSIGDSMLQEFLSYSNSLSRFTIHTIEDLRKELNRRANVLGDHVLRPNSPEEQMRVPAYPLSPGRESSVPLIYSSTFTAYSGDSFTPKSNSSKPMPRPMSSLLKEKLDLKLDLNPRCSESATTTDSQLSRSPNSPRSSPERSVKSSTSEKLLPEESTSDCVHCAIAAVLGQEADAEPTSEVKDGMSTPEVKVDLTTPEVKQTEGPDTNLDHDKEEQGKDAANLEAQGLSSERAKSPMVNGDMNDHTEIIQPDSSRIDTSRTDADRESLHSDEEPELQNLTVGPGSERSASAPPQPHAPATHLSPTMETPRTRKSTSTLQINIPQVDLHDPGDRQSEKTPRGRAPIMKGRQTPLSDRPIPRYSPMSSRSALRTSRLTIQGRSRPFSAMDAYRFIVNHPRRPINTETGYNTTYQQQRTEAWRQSTHCTASQQPCGRTVKPPITASSQQQPPPNNNSNSILQKGYSVQILKQLANSGDPDETARYEPAIWICTVCKRSLYRARQSTPPPQRPTSPTMKSRPTSAISVQRGSEWLGGGRDLYWESMQKRPVSCHVPGWKEGLPESMKRPKSAAVARSMKRQSKRTVPLTPSSMAYESMLHGNRGHSPRSTPLKRQSPLPDMLQLSDYHPLSHQLGVPRRLGDTGSPDFYSQSAQDTVYRSSSPVMLSPIMEPSAQSYQSPPVYMSCIYEDEDLLSTTGLSEAPLSPY